MESRAEKIMQALYKGGKLNPSRRNVSKEINKKKAENEHELFSTGLDFEHVVQSLQPLPDAQSNVVAVKVTQNGHNPHLYKQNEPMEEDEHTIVNTTDCGKYYIDLQNCIPPSTTCFSQIPASEAEKTVENLVFDEQYQPNFDFNEDLFERLLHDDELGVRPIQHDDLEETRIAKESKVKKRLEFDDYQSGQVQEAQGSENNCQGSCLDSALIKELENRIEYFSKQKIQASKDGHKSTARRKARRVKQLQDALNNAKQGKNVDLNQLPVPFPDVNVFQEQRDIDIINQPPMDVTNEEFDHIEGAKEKKTTRKENYCIYCKTLVKKYGEHIEKKHPETEEGKALLKINEETCNKIERRIKKSAITAFYRKKGNAEYNRELLKGVVLGETRKNLITVKRGHAKSPPKSSENAQNIVICKFCEGYYFREKISLHKCEGFEKSTMRDTQEACNSKISVRDSTTPVITHTEGLTESFKVNILTKMHNDTEGQIVRNDHLILKVGNLFHKSRNLIHQRGYVSSRLRFLARLVMYGKQDDETIQSLYDLIDPGNFNTLCSAMRKLNYTNEETGRVGKPGVAYMILPLLKLAGRVAKEDAVIKLHQQESGDRKYIEKAEDFLALVSDKWADEVGRNSRKTLKNNRAVTINEAKIADSNDIATLCSFIINQYDEEMKSIEQETARSYESLLDLLVSHIMCLIRRRPVDFQLATIEHYNLLDNQDQLVHMIKNDIVGESLSKEDIETCKRFHIFYVPGKNSEIVPIVLTPKMKDVMDCLVRSRGHAHIKSERLFARPGDKLLDAGKSLERIKNKVKLENPGSLTALGLRKQAATFSRLQSKDPQYQDYLASALGHKLFVHKTHYELPSSIIQKLKVLPILHSMTEKEKDDIPSLEPIIGESDEDEMERSLKKTKKWSEPVIEESYEDEMERPMKKRKKWSQEENLKLISVFGDRILAKEKIPRKEIVQLWSQQQSIFSGHSAEDTYQHVRNFSLRNQTGVTPLVKRLKRNS